VEGSQWTSLRSWTRWQVLHQMRRFNSLRFDSFQAPARCRWLFYWVGFFFFFSPNKMMNILILCRKSSLSQMSCASLLTRSSHSKPARYIGGNFTRDGNQPSQNLHERNVMWVVSYSGARY
jgi:hypothetical protein